MIVSSGFLTVMVMFALAVTIIAPVILVALWIKDWKGKKLW